VDIWVLVPSEKDWDRKIKLSMLASKQGERLFTEWVYELINRNTLLRGWACHFTNEALRELFANNMDQGLKLHSQRIISGLTEEAMIRDWIEAVKEEDEFMMRECAMAREVVIGLATGPGRRTSRQSKRGGVYPCCEVFQRQTEDEGENATRARRG